MSAIQNGDRIALLDYPWPVFAEDEVSAACNVLRSGKVNYWTGKLGREFEARFAGFVGVNHAVAMANGTLTLQACLRALDIGPGSEVITTPRTFMGTGSAIVLEGATPIFADVCRDSGNIHVDSVEKLITPKTRAILPVHLGGWPCEMEKIMSLARAYGLKVIEDCAQSHGALIHGKHAGTFGHMSSWSFCQEKIMTTGGEGGMVGTNDSELWARAWALKDHGKSYATVYEQDPKVGFRWVHDSWGSNWRLTEMQSAIGLCQLGKLPDWTRLRTRNALILEEALRPVGALRVPEVPSVLNHAYYKLYLYVRPEALKSDWSRDRILDALTRLGIPGQSGACPEIYLERAFKDSGLMPQERLPVAQELGSTSIMLQVHPTIPEEIIRRVGSAVESCVREASK